MWFTRSDYMLLQVWDFAIDILISIASANQNSENALYVIVDKTNFWQRKQIRKLTLFFRSFKFESSEISSISFMYILLKLWIYYIELSITLCLAIFITLSSTLYEALAMGFTFQLILKLILELQYFELACTHISESIIT